MRTGPSPLQVRFAKNRIRWSRAILALTIFVVLFSRPPHYVAGTLKEVLELSGYLMLACATLWRIWCLVFIGGSKDNELATTGPYSVVRNPLYIAHFIAIVGFALSVGFPGVAMTLAILFGVLYPAVVVQEERRLVELFGPVYERYCSRVPRWFPQWSLYEEPQTVVVSIAKMRQGILDAMWYLWAFAFSELLEALRDHSVLPQLF